MRRLAVRCTARAHLHEALKDTLIEVLDDPTIKKLVYTKAMHRFAQRMPEAFAAPRADASAPSTTTATAGSVTVPASGGAVTASNSATSSQPQIASGTQTSGAAAAPASAAGGAPAAMAATTSVPIANGVRGGVSDNERLNALVSQMSRGVGK